MKPSKEEIEQFGTWLRNARASRGVKIDDLAKAAGVSRSTVINLEQHKARGLNPGTKIALENYFSGSVDIGALNNIHYNGLEDLRNMFERIADIILSSDFEERVDGLMQILRVSKRDAIAQLLESDLKKPKKV